VLVDDVKRRKAAKMQVLHDGDADVAAQSVIAHESILHRQQLAEQSMLQLRSNNTVCGTNSSLQVLRLNVFK